MQKTTRIARALRSDDPSRSFWKDIIPPDVIELYSNYRREVGCGALARARRDRPVRARLPGRSEARAGGDDDVSELLRRIRLGGDRADQRLFAAARAAGVPIFYSTGDTRPHSQPKNVRATRRQGVRIDPAMCAIRPEFAPHPEDVCDHQGEASAFFGTPLLRRISRQLGREERHRVRREQPRAACGRPRWTPIPRFSRDAGRGVLLRPQPPLAQGQPLRHAPTSTPTCCT